MLCNKETHPPDEIGIFDKGWGTSMFLPEWVDGEEVKMVAVKLI